jgi:hypothetical protein
LRPLLTVVWIMSQHQVALIVSLPGALEISEEA